MRCSISKLSRVGSLWKVPAGQGLKQRGIVVKVNCIVIPGVNDHQVSDVAEKMAELGVDVLNCMAMVPNAGTPFADLAEPSHAQMAEIRNQAEQHLPQMKHCQRCRADAVGLLEAARSGEFHEVLEEISTVLPMQTDDRPHVAVATLEGVLVNRHLGEADRFQIWGRNSDGYQLVEERAAPSRGGGVERWRNLAAALKDCRAVLVSGVGETPMAVLSGAGVLPVEMSGFIELGLQAVYRGDDPKVFRRRKGGGCSKGLGCGGDGGGCG